MWKMMLNIDGKNKNPVFSLPSFFFLNSWLKNKRVKSIFLKLLNIEKCPTPTVFSLWFNFWLFTVTKSILPFHFCSWGKLDFNIKSPCYSFRVFAHDLSTFYLKKCNDFIGQKFDMLLNRYMSTFICFSSNDGVWQAHFMLYWGPHVFMNTFCSLKRNLKISFLFLCCHAINWNSCCFMFSHRKTDSIC